MLPTALPTVADVLALDAVRRGAPRVLTGARRLDAPVRWVHVIELAEAGHLLRGGELVLSTGIALPPDPDGLARYVAGLAAAGISALAVELGTRYVRELPRALVRAAAAHDLPLIALERETHFIAVTEAVHAQILDAQVAELREAQRLHEIFTGLAVAGAGQEQIVARASTLAGVPVILADLAHRVLACAPAGRDTAPLLAGFAGRSRAIAAGQAGYDAASGWLTVPVGASGTDWGRLIFVLAGEPGAGLAALAERAATALALSRLVAGPRGELGPERAAHRSVLAELAGPGYADHEGLAARIAALGVPVAGRRLLPVVIADRDRAGSPDLAVEAVAAACRDLGVPALCGTLDDQSVAALLALLPGTDPAATLRHVAARLRQDDGAGARSAVIGAGPPVPGLAQVRGALAEAAAAAGAAARQRAGPPFTRLADLHLTGLLYQLRDDPRVLAFSERELGPLLAHDERHGTDLTGVLAAYLECGASKARAAHRAGLARPTLYQRLRQIEQVAGVSLDDPQARLGLHAALVAVRICADAPAW